MSPTLAIAPKQPTRTGWALLLTSVAFFMVIATGRSTPVPGSSRADSGVWRAENSHTRTVCTTWPA